MSIINLKNGIKKDTNVFGWNYYAGKGQSCATVWYPSVETALKVISKIGKVPTGFDSGLCDECTKNNIDSGLPIFLCSKWKENIVKNIIEEIEKD